MIIEIYRIKVSILVSVLIQMSFRISLELDICIFSIILMIKTPIFRDKYDFNYYVFYYISQLVPVL